MWAGGGHGGDFVSYMGIVVPLLVFPSSYLLTPPPPSSLTSLAILSAAPLPSVLIQLGRLRTHSDATLDISTGWRIFNDFIASFAAEEKWEGEEVVGERRRRRRISGISNFIYIILVDFHH